MLRACARARAGHRWASHAPRSLQWYATSEEDAVREAGGRKGIKSVELELAKAKEGIMKAEDYELLGVASGAAQESDVKHAKESTQLQRKLLPGKGQPMQVPLFAKRRWTKKEAQQRVRRETIDSRSKRSKEIVGDLKERERALAIAKAELRLGLDRARTQASVRRGPGSDPSLPDWSNEASAIIAVHDKDSPEYETMTAAKRRRLNAVIAWAKKEHPDSWGRIVSRIALKEKLHGRPWRPSMLIPYEAMDEIKELRADAPDEWTPAALAEKFRISQTAVQKILHSRYEPTVEERIVRQLEVKAMWGLVNVQRRRVARKAQSILLEADLRQRYGDLYSPPEKEEKRVSEEVVFDEAMIKKLEADGALDPYEEDEDGEDDSDGLEETGLAAENRRVRRATKKARKKELELEEDVIDDDLFTIEEKDVDDWLGGTEMVSKRNIYKEAQELVRHKMQQLSRPKYAKSKAAFEKLVSEEKRRLADKRFLEATEESIKKDEARLQQRSFFNLNRVKREATNAGDAEKVTGKEDERPAKKGKEKPLDAANLKRVLNPEPSSSSGLVTRKRYVPWKGSSRGSM